MLRVLTRLCGPHPPPPCLPRSNHRLNWPEGASSKKSLKAVQRLKGLRAYLRQHCEDAARPHLDTIVGACCLGAVLGCRCLGCGLWARQARGLGHSALCVHTDQAPPLACLRRSCPADLLKRMLEYRAADRISAAEALQHPFFRLQL